MRQFVSQSRHPRRPDFVAQQLHDTFVCEALLPVSHGSLGDPGLPHDGDGAKVRSSEEYVPAPPDMAPRAVAVRGICLDTNTISGAEGETDLCTYTPNSNGNK
ncbi:MAG: hypothetical protein RID07_11520 [Lacipirellulaceae bacterium]